jgi:hypothetical protein
MMNQHKTEVCAEEECCDLSACRVFGLIVAQRRRWQQREENGEVGWLEGVEQSAEGFGEAVRIHAKMFLIIPISYIKVGC